MLSHKTFSDMRKGYIRLSRNRYYSAPVSLPRILGSKLYLWLVRLIWPNAAAPKLIRGRLHCIGVKLAAFREHIRYWNARVQS